MSAQRVFLGTVAAVAIGLTSLQPLPVVAADNKAGVATPTPTPQPDVSGTNVHVDGYRWRVVVQ
jgi:hypothetical protein